MMNRNYIEKINIGSLKLPIFKIGWEYNGL